MATAAAGDGRGKPKGSKSVSRSVKAGLQFLVGRVAQHLKVGDAACRGAPPSTSAPSSSTSPPRPWSWPATRRATTTRRLVLVGSCIEGVSGLNGMLAIWFMYSASDFSMAT
ncbi:hypothetical protein ZWY2020_049329 [Hordeum vulgare]|nr:hypothetical protein ZWY2020_049329 [Hordeum vulgare]